MMSFVIIRLPSKRDMDTQWTHKKLSKERMTSYLQFQHHRLNTWLTISRNLDWGGGWGECRQPPPQPTTALQEVQSSRDLTKSRERKYLFTDYLHITLYRVSVWIVYRSTF